MALVGDPSSTVTSGWKRSFSGAKRIELISSLQNLNFSSLPEIIVVPSSFVTTIQDLTSIQEIAKSQSQLVFVIDTESELDQSIKEICGLSDTSVLGLGEWYLRPLGISRNPDKLPYEEFAIRAYCTELTLRFDSVEILGQISAGYRNRSIAVRYNNILTLGFSLLRDEDFDVELVRTIHRFCFSPKPEIKAPIVVGIIGYGAYGGMGHFHGTGCTQTEFLEFGAIAEHNAERRKSAITEYPNITTYEHALDLIRDNDIDLVIIATPPDTHFQLAKIALENNKHVVLEKPMCLTVSEADELIELSRSAKRVLTVHQNRRFDGDFQALLEIVNSGELGEIFNIETFVGSFEHPCRAWHSEESISGGAAYDWGSHHIDWILRLYQQVPAEVTVNVHKRVWNDITNADQIRIHLTFDDGREAEFVQSDVAAIRKPKFYVQGTKGTAVGHYAPVTNESVNFPFGYQVTKFHHAEAPVSFTMTTYEHPSKSRTTVVDPTKVLPFEFHRNLANHLVFGEELSITPESVRPVIEILEVSQSLSNSNQRYARLTR